jgi:hypothetical protein
MVLVAGQNDHGDDGHAPKNHQRQPQDLRYWTTRAIESDLRHIAVLSVWRGAVFHRLLDTPGLGHEFRARGKKKRQQLVRHNYSAKKQENIGVPHTASFPVKALRGGTLLRAANSRNAAAKRTGGTRTPLWRRSYASWQHRQARIPTTGLNASRPYSRRQIMRAASSARRRHGRQPRPRRRSMRQTNPSRSRTKRTKRASSALVSHEGRAGA